MKDVSIKVMIRKDKVTKDEQCPVYFLIGRVVKGKRLKFPAKISFHKNNWDEKNEKPKKLVDQNDRKYYEYLERVKNNFKAFVCDLNIKGMNINEDTIKSFFRRNNGEGDYTCFYTFFEEFIEEAITDKTLAKNTIKAYKSTLNVMKQFKPNVTFKDIDLSFIKKFDAYLKNIRGNSVGGLFNRHKHMRKLINIASERGSMSINPYPDFKIEKVKARVNFLNEKQIEQMENLELNTIALQRTRDMFLFSCYTGLRYGDVTILTKNNFKDLAELKHVIVKQQKTKRNVEIMLIEKAKKIIERYFVEEEKPFKISNQKVNKNLKELAERIDIIDFNLTFHIARHTFATYLVNKGAPIFHVSKLLGHTSIKDTQVYTKADTKSMGVTMELFNKKVAE